MIIRLVIATLPFLVALGCASGKPGSNCPDECRRQYTAPDKQAMCIKFCK